jgi:ATP adenylyltransferase
VQCKYCEAAEPGAPEGLRELAAWPATRVYLLPDAQLPGRCVVASRVHVRELHELAAAARSAFVDEVASVARTVQAVLHADKMNIGLFGDIVDHLHAHVVPKRAGGPFWGSPFLLAGEASVERADTEKVRAAFVAVREALARQA